METPAGLRAFAALSAVFARIRYSHAPNQHGRPFISIFARSFSVYPNTVRKAPYLVAAALCVIGAAASAMYVSTILLAWIMGWALPTTALIRSSTVGKWAATNEPFFAYPLIGMAAVGAVMTWLIVLAAPNRRSEVELNEGVLRRIFCWCGFPIIACAFTLSTSAIWTGIVRPGDPNGMNIGGLIPFMDGGAYLATAFDQVKDGIWNDHGLRRPLAASFRSVLLLSSGFSLQAMLILQAVLLAGATWFATRAIMAWRGVWVGIAFVSLIYIYARLFVSTTLTESLGIFWALLSIPFFIEAFRSHSAKSALIAFAMTAVALMTRMGAMFTLPALIVWLVWQFGKGTLAKLKVFAAATGILFAVLGLNSLLQSMYGNGPSPSTGNFAYVLCGLSMGTTWDGCLKELSDDRIARADESDNERAKQLYSLAWKHLRADPLPLLRRLTEGLQAFVTQYPVVMWRGYGRVPDRFAWLGFFLVASAVVGLILYHVVHRTNELERTFWMLFWASILASSCFIYLDDGERAIAASHPIIALFVALALSSHSSFSEPEAKARTLLLRCGALGLITAALLFVSVPWLLHYLLRDTSIPFSQHEAFVFGGRRMSGFLVVSDDQPLRNDVPSIHLTDFSAIVRDSGIERYQDLIHPTLPPLPFGFVFAPRMERNLQSDFQYIVPAEVIQRRDVPAWHFNLARWGGAENRLCVDCWFYVTKAAPLLASSAALR